MLPADVACVCLIEILVTLDKLFDILDLDQDGAISRSELLESARRLGWYWNEAPVFAVLDLLSVVNPVPRETFVDCMTQMIRDPQGPYGSVLLKAGYFRSATAAKSTVISKARPTGPRQNHKKRQPSESNDESYEQLMALLARSAGPNIAEAYQGFLQSMEIGRLEFSADDAALLIIDPQRSFTKGAWMQSIGRDAELEVDPIQWAFVNSARFLKDNDDRLETMFTRCPFPPDSYDWDDAFAGIIDPRQLYFIKPGNSVLFPPTNGFCQWVEGLIAAGKTILVMAGCTLNSCVRVSSIATQKYFKDRRLQVVVNLSLCGARTRNFTPSSLYNGMSAVESAVREMMAEGVKVTLDLRVKPADSAQNNKENMNEYLE